MPDLTRVERENMESERDKNVKVEWREKLKEENVRRKKEANDGIHLKL